jgi:hypothetical protein
MSILYIEDKIKEKERKQEIIDTLESIGLTPSDLFDIEDDVKKRLNKIQEYQEWVKERFFQEYELNEHKIISPKFGDD